MTNVAEKAGEVKEKPAAPEKRRALGRGLESLLPGPRVVAGSAVSPVAPRSPAAAPPAVASPAAPAGNSAIANSSSLPDSSDLSSSSGSVATSGPVATPSGASSEGIPTQATSVPTHSQSPLRDGAPSTSTRSSFAEEPIETRAVSPMAGLEREVVRNENIGSAAAPARVVTHATHSSLTSRPSLTPERASTESGELAPSVGSVPAQVATQASQVSATERREPGAPSPLAVGDLQGVAESSDFEGVQVTELALDKIDPNPYQTRHFTHEDEEELVELGKSIKAQGLIQPITVREGKNGRYVLIAGDRRTRASRLAELKTIPAIIWEVGEQEAAEMTIIENLMREDLNCMDQTRAFVLLSSKFHMTQAQIADRMGMSRESVSNYMRLARLPQEVQDYLINSELEYSHARLLLKIDNDDVLVKVARKVAKEHIPVWELEEMMLSSNPTLLKPPDEKKQSRGARWVDPNVKAAQRDLERVLGMRVRIRDRNNKGRIVIEYSTLEDFDRVVGTLKGKGGR